MKKLYLISILFLVLAWPSKGQMDSLKFDKLLLDFTVPDMPAFKAIGADPSNILRPSDIKKLAVMIAPFVSSGQGIIINSFALEVAPFKLLDAQSKNPLKMSDISGNTRTFRKFLYHTGLSIGTNQTENEQKKKVFNLSIGLRTSFVGKKGDIYRSEESKSIYNKMMTDQSAKQELESKWVTEGKISLDELNDASNPKTKNLRKAISELHNSKVADEIVKNFNANHWNANRGEVAFAWVGQSPDSLIGNIRSSNWNLWGVYANDLTSKKSQLLIGTTLKYFESTASAAAGWDVTFNARLYHGTKDFRAFAEYQFKKLRADLANTGLINIGSELRVLKEFWIVLSGGVENVYATGSKSQFVTKFDIRYSFNKSN